jgi:hypothetical protein
VGGGGCSDTTGWHPKGAGPNACGCAHTTTRLHPTHPHPPAHTAHSTHTHAKVRGGTGWRHHTCAKMFLLTSTTMNARHSFLPSSTSFQYTKSGRKSS